MNDQRSSDITYSSALDEYFVCWNDGRDTFQNDEGDEVADVNILCSTLNFDTEVIPMHKKSVFSHITFIGKKI